MGQTPFRVSMVLFVRKLFKERSIHANVPLDLLENIVSKLEYHVVRFSVSIMLNAWMKQVMFTSVHRIGKEAMIVLYQPLQQVPIP